MSEVWAEAGGVRLTLGMAAGACAVIAAAVFAGLWYFAHRKRPPAGWADALGFGLLPGVAVWKIFESLAAADGGRAADEPLPLLPWVTEGGAYMPPRIEFILAVAAFCGICLWLILKKEEIGGRGEVLLTSLCLWSGIRVFTERLRTDPDRIRQYVYAGLILACLACWTAKRFRRGARKGRSAGDWTAALICTAMIVLTSEGILSVGSGIGDLAVVFGCAALEVLLTLLCGSDERKADAPKAARPDSGDTIVMKPV